MYRLTCVNKKVQANEHHSHLTSRELNALFSDYDNLQQPLVEIKLDEGITAHCSGCLKSKMISGRLCIVVNVKFAPKDCFFAVDRKFYFCAVVQCLKNKPWSSNLRCPPEKVKANRTIDDSAKQLLKARNIFMSYQSTNIFWMSMETLGKVGKYVQILWNIINFRHY